MVLYSHLKRTILSTGRIASRENLAFQMGIQQFKRPWAISRGLILEAADEI